ncbi:MAG: dGTPase [Cyclobacteriaceae bacterium]|jgi:dGTPase
MNWLELLSPRRFGDKQDVEIDHTNRSRFDQDYDRLIFSHPFRKLQDKTQVFPLPEDDFVHTRLTHSLEVSSVGRSLGKDVGAGVLERHPELKAAGYTTHDFGGIVAAASLAHDLGNPPFGHSGETAISSFYTDNDLGKVFQEKVKPEEWTDLISFEGNAQGFRILNDEMNGGLKLTFACLGAFTKYPRLSHCKSEKARKSQKKYGIYASSKAEYKELADQMNLSQFGENIWSRHPLAFLVEAADDICYGIIDLEDGCRLGLVSFEQTRDLLGKIIGENFKPEKLEKILGQNGKLGLLRAMAIHKLVQECVVVFLENEAHILNAEFDKALTDVIPSKDIMAEISGLSINKIYRSKQVLEREAGGFEVIGKLMEAFTLSAHNKYFDQKALSPKQKSVFRLLPEEQQIKLNQEGLTVYSCCQIIGDFISSLTDSYAIKLYRIVFGYSLPSSRG